MTTFPHAISTTHPVEILPASFGPFGDSPEVPPDLRPALVAILTCFIKEQGITYTIAHVVAPEQGREVYLYPTDNDFARVTCEKLSMEERNGK